MGKAKAGLLGVVTALVMKLVSIFGMIEGVKIWAEETPRIVEAFDEAGKEIQANGNPISIIAIFVPLILMLVWLGIRLKGKL